MQSPLLPDTEAQRLASLRALDLLDTDADERFDRITRLAARLFDVPIALVSLIDSHRQWFKSKYGLEAEQTERSISFCGHAILNDDILYVPDTLQDTRFNDNPLVTGLPHIRFYAGAPISAANGHKLGTVCLIDRRPRNLTDEDKTVLRDIAVMVENEIRALQLATIDELTQIANLRGFNLTANKMMAISNRSGSSAALLIFDLNNFKTVNDTFGHAEGDQLLIAFADLLQKGFRAYDSPARIGGDEFAVLMLDVSDREVSRILRRFQQLVHDFNQSKAAEKQLAYSVGVAFSRSPHSLKELKQRADKLMYVDKARSRNIRSCGDRDAQRAS